MARIVAYRRAGMTLVELLVVVAILGLLAVAVLPTLATTADARRSREATRVVSSYVAKAQSRAIGRTEWAGFWMTAPATSGSVKFALDLYLADAPALFRGDSTSAMISGNSTGSRFVITSGSLNGVTVSGSTGDLVRFDGQPPWYAFLSGTAVGLRDGSSYSGIALEDVGQSSVNTPLPAAGTAHRFEVLRQPINAGSSVTIPDGRCIDLSWSGYGGSSLGTYSTWAGLGGTSLALYSSPGSPPQSIAILFDGTGRLRQLFYNNARVTASSPVFLLVGRSDRAGNAAAVLNSADDSLGANWQYSDSFWIAIDPLSGVAKTAECAKQAGLATDDVFSSQSFIRSEIVAGGR